MVDHRYLHPNDGNTRTGIPVPSTIVRPTPDSRMSLSGPGPTRAPYPSANASGFNPRQSMYRSQNTNPLLMSTSKAQGRTPLDSARRGSTWQGGNNFAPPPPSQPAKDPRPLRERSYQAKMRQDVLAYLQSAGLDITMSTLANINGKDYRAIFDYLILCLDPTFPFSSGTPVPKEFTSALKSVRYPYINQVDPKWLAAPASMHSWPTLLGVLHWLVEACKVKQAYMTSSHPSLQLPSDVPEDFQDEHDHRALTFEYFQQAYASWLALKDEFTEAEQALEDRYVRKDEAIQIQVDSMTRELDERTLEYSKLKSSAAPIAKLENENALLKTDGEKFQEILQRYESRRKKLMDTIAQEKIEIGSRELHLEQLKREHVQLLIQVEQQNMSEDDVLRMTSEHDSLSQQIAELSHKAVESQKAVLALEVNVAHELGATEDSLDTYTNFLSSLDLFPPLPPPHQDTDLTLELNPAVSNVSELLIGPNIRKVVKPTLSSIAEARRSERANLESERIRVDDEVEKIALECENLDEDIAEMDKKVSMLNDQADELRDAAQREALKANREAEALEDKLTKARTAAITNGMSVKSRLQTLQVSYQEQVEKVSKLKDQTIRAVLKNSHDIVMFKEEVSKHLNDLREFAESDIQI